MSDEPKIIYSMVRVSKYYDKKPVIENISLSYFYGAKIGVLGLNGSGKSTLLTRCSKNSSVIHGASVVKNVVSTLSSTLLATTHVGDTSACCECKHSLRTKDMMVSAMLPPGAACSK